MKDEPAKTNPAGTPTGFSVTGCKVRDAVQLRLPDRLHRRMRAGQVPGFLHLKQLVAA